MKFSRRQFSRALGITAALPAFPSLSLASPNDLNVIIVRFGGGVRRRETIDPATTWAPYLVHQLAPRGVLLPNMQIEAIAGMNTSHAEGTINILTGQYAAWRSVGERVVAETIEPTAPTIFEYLRKANRVPAHQVLLINGENRPQEEFFSFAKHNRFGGDFRADVLSLHRYKRWLIGKLREEGKTDSKLYNALQDDLNKMRSHEISGRSIQSSRQIDDFWVQWRRDFLDSGLRNPRGDRLLTELAVRAMHHLRPRLMMINYQDPDYVHWGVASHYTRAIAIIDDGLKRLVETADRLESYAGRTLFVVIPDCGRDDNSLLSIPYQHHFNTKSAHEIWMLVFGPGIARNRQIDKIASQHQVAATIGAALNIPTPHTDGEALAEVFS